MALNKLKLPTIRLGASVDIPIRVETDALTFAPISSISRAAPARIVTTDPHGVLDGWRCAVVDAKGMTDINAASSRHPISDKDMHVVSVIDSTTLDMLGVSSLAFRAHTADTGAVAFYSPKDLAGYTAARMDVKTSSDDTTALITFHTDDGTLEIDTANSALWLRLLPDTLSTALVGVGEYVTDIELIRADGVDALCLTSPFIVIEEVTTSV
jgi:hypothetical protein